jgi:hypothetical protein
MLSTRLNMTGKPSCHNRLKSWVARDVRASLQRCLDTKRLISVTSRWVKAEATLTRELAAQSQYPVISSKMPTPAAQQITPGRFANMANMANDRTQRCGRPVAPELATEVVRPHSL